MNKMKLMLTALAVSLMFVASATATQAATLRAFVSSTGSDGNVGTNCAQAAPCRTFAAAFPTVTPGGELIALDTAGYGPLTITNAITVATVPGATAFVVAAAGTNGFTISAGASDLVRIRNINFNGSGAANTTGLRHNSGRLTVENCSFQQLTIGVDNFAKMDLIDCEVHGNGTGLKSTGTGTFLQSDVSVAQLRVNRGNVTLNTTGTHQVNAGLNANQNPLFNILVFSNANGGSLNIAGNTTNMTCTGMSCQGQPLVYSMTSDIK